MKKGKTGVGTAGTVVTAGRGAQMKMTADGTHSQEPTWKDGLINFIVMTDQGLSVSFEEVCYL